MRYPCSQCEYAATTASHLKRHVESKHEEVRYPCPECKYAATEKGALKKHLENKHNWVQISLFWQCCQGIAYKFTIYQTLIFFCFEFVETFVT